jgi:AraC-like DNA-binding protein
MLDEGYSSKEAAFAVGIDPINFSRSFKRVYKKTPKEFSKENQKSK